MLNLNELHDLMDKRKHILTDFKNAEAELIRCQKLFTAAQETLTTCQQRLDKVENLVLKYIEGK